jgi:hypothetical protein
LHAARLLRSFRDRGRTNQWLADHAEQIAGRDPAYAQAVRLYIKEERYLRDIVIGTLGTLAPPTPTRFDRFIRPWALSTVAAIRRRLGLRFDLSIRLIGHVTDMHLLEAAGHVAVPAMPRALLDQLTASKRAHLAFHAERLTADYADFDFFRRNATRVRLRLMAAVALTYVALRHRRSLRAARISPLRFATTGLTRFQRMLRRVLPYRRRELLNTLVAQQRSPFDDPMPWSAA